MATYNGSRFISEQLDSFADQTYQNWAVIVSDDGSQDNTLDILHQYQKNWGKQKLQVLSGPQKGFCQNFLSLCCNDEIDSEYFAFSDQDDVWCAEKLQVAIEYLEQQDPNIPTVYCGRTAYVDENLKPLGLSPLFTYPRRFRNALVQSIAGGNTMVFNRATKKLLEAAGPLEVVSHDWWLYLLVMGAGGKVYYDKIPYIHYRQHPQALIGGNSSLLESMERVFLTIKGRFRQWNDININALLRSQHLLSENNNEVLALFLRLRDSHLLHRCRMLEVCGIYRQTKRGTISLFMAAILGKI